VPQAFWNFDGFDPIRVQIQLSAVEPDSLREYLAEQTEQMRASVAAGDRAFIIIDARAGLRPPPAVRRIQAEWIKEHEALLAASMIGMAFVIESRMVRGALTAIFWVAGPPVKYTLCPSLDEAMAVAIRECDAANLSVPSSVRSARGQDIEDALARHTASTG
jgi:hypothetical protein